MKIPSAMSLPAFSLGCACACACAAEAPDASRLNDTRPNIVYILIDDLGWTDLGCMGGDFYETPNIDRLCAQGMRFTHAYGAAPVCAPARAAILTGRYPVRTGITDVFMPKKAVRMTPLVERWTSRDLPESEQTLGQLMQSAGYATACIGKWHVGTQKGSLPEDKGFDCVVKSRKKDLLGDYKGMNRYTDAAIAFIEQNKHRPFFLYLAHDAVHLPYPIDADLTAKYEKKLRPGLTHTMPAYAATIEYLDKKVGELLAALDRLGLAENTLVIFTSDNGGRASFYDYQLVTRNDPLRAGKHTLYEGAIRVPFIARWSGKIAADSTNASVTHQTDLFPTLAALAGARAHPLPVLDGQSMLPLFEGRAVAPRTLFWFYPHYNIASTWGKNTICEPMRPCAAVLEGDWKLIEWFEDKNEVELFNVREDPGEKTNMARVMPEKVAALRARLAAWYPTVGARIPQKRADYDPDLRHCVLWRFGDARTAPNTEKYLPENFPDDLKKLLPTNP